jgi:predicted transcriptional regulator
MPHGVTDAELNVLQALWERGTATTRQLTDQLYPGGRSSDFATVQKLLERLEAKGCVCRDRGGNVQVFSAAVGREELLGRWLRGLAEKLCNGSLAPLLTYLVRGRALSARERRLLRELVDELGEKPRKERGKEGR